MHPLSLSAVARAVVVALAAITLVQLGATAPAAAGSRDLPQTVQDGRGHLHLSHRDGTGITERQARSVDVRQVRYSRVARDGRRFASIDVRLARTLPPRPHYRQSIKVFFDQERLLRTNVGTGRTKFVGTSSDAPLRKGCRQGVTTVDDHAVTILIPLACLVADESEMYLTSALRSPVNRRIVSYDVSNTGLLRWR